MADSASAETYYEHYQLKPFFGKVIEEIRVAKATFRSLCSSPSRKVYEHRSAVYRDAIRQLATLRKRQQTGEIAEKEVYAEYGRVADAMNMLEVCTRKSK